jgi:hypothetical protein
MSAPDLLDKAAVKAKLGSRAWRLNNLYTIQDKLGREVRFKLNEVQRELDNSLHNRNLVLKSRQHGVTTWACIRALDTALFKHGQACGLVFHKKEEAIKAFGTKIMYAYDRLPAWLRAELPILKRDMTGKVEFENGSRIEVSTSHRGGTLQFLHISEYGPMVAMFPARAEEVSSGALNTLAPDTIICIESTAMGAWGDFYDRCQRALTHDRKVEAGVATRTALDYKLHFFGWWMDPTNRLSEEDAATVEIPKTEADYFDTLEAEFECRIFHAQRAWFVKKSEEQKDKMKREHPSTPKEAFEGSVEGAYYAVELARAERDGRIGSVPYLPALPVYTAWDLGRSDFTAIWFFQLVGPWVHFIRYYENNHQSIAHYAGILRTLRDEEGYRYARHYLPHDAGVTDYSRTDNKTRREVLEAEKIGECWIVERVENLADGIEMTRQFLNRCRFDAVRCGEDPVGSGRGGLLSLKAYRKSYDERHGIWSDVPMKSWANHGADAIRQAAEGCDVKPEKPAGKPKSRTRDRRRSAMTR